MIQSIKGRDARQCTGTRPGEWASRAGVELSTTDMAYLLVSGGDVRMCFASPEAHGRFLQRCIDSDGSTMNPREKVLTSAIGEVYVIEENGHRTLMPEGSCFGHLDSDFFTGTLQTVEAFSNIFAQWFLEYPSDMHRKTFSLQFFFAADFWLMTLQRDGKVIKTVEVVILGCL